MQLCKFAVYYHRKLFFQTFAFIWSLVAGHWSCVWSTSFSSAVILHSKLFLLYCVVYCDFSQSTHLFILTTIIQYQKHFFVFFHEFELQNLEFLHHRKWKRIGFIILNSDVTICSFIYPVSWAPHLAISSLCVTKHFTVLSVSFAYLKSAVPLELSRTFCSRCYRNLLCMQCDYNNRSYWVFIKSFPYCLSNLMVAKQLLWCLVKFAVFLSTSFLWSGYFTVSVALVHNVLYIHREAGKKEPIVFCIYLFCTWQKLVNSFTYTRLKEIRSISYNCVYLILVCVENFAATVTLNVLSLPVK